MSRIGNNPIAIPEGVSVEISDNKIVVKGKLGEIEQEPKFMSIVSTQAVCLLKLGDFMTAKTFAEQVD